MPDASVLGVAGGVAAAALVAKVLFKTLRRASKRTWLGVFGVVVAVAMTQGRHVANVAIRLASTPLDEELGVLAMPSPDALAAHFAGKSVLCVGCTKGIGRGIADALAELDVTAEVVGRSAEKYAFDVSTVGGCHALGDALLANGTAFDVVFFTVGVWPDSHDPFTEDGLEKVYAIDLLARHVILERLVRDDLLQSGAVVVNTLASGQDFPFMSSPLVKHRLTNNRRRPTSLISAVLPIAVAADVYLRAAAHHFPGFAFAGVFPGLVATDLASSTFPPVLARLYKAAVTPFATPALSTGTAHLAIAAAVSRLNRSSGRTVSYWNHLLEAREPHHLVFDNDLVDFVWANLRNASLPRGAADPPPAEDAADGGGGEKKTT